MACLVDDDTLCLVCFWEGVGTFIGRSPVRCAVAQYRLWPHFFKKEKFKMKYLIAAVFLYSAFIVGGNMAIGIADIVDPLTAQERDDDFSFFSQAWCLGVTFSTEHFERCVTEMISAREELLFKAKDREANPKAAF